MKPVYEIVCFFSIPGKLQELPLLQTNMVIGVKPFLSTIVDGPPTSHLRSCGIIVSEGGLEARNVSPASRMLYLQAGHCHLQRSVSS